MTRPETTPVVVHPGVEALRQRLAARRWVSVITGDGRALLVDRGTGDAEQAVIAELLARNIEPLRAALDEDGPYLLAEIDRLRDLVVAQRPQLTELAALVTRDDEQFGAQDWPDGTATPEALEWADTAASRVSERGSAGLLTWADLLDAQAALVTAEADPALLRDELLHLAVIAVNWVRALDHRAGHRVTAVDGGVSTHPCTCPEQPGPSLGEQAADWHGRGYSTAEIAAGLGVDEATAAALIAAGTGEQR
ncbi:MAG: hypothetical protein HOQ45_10535 [Nocardioidaceae bacterium]|nr:hypothetical protein [Nocardioidaceae bacterium]